MKAIAAFLLVLCHLAISHGDGNQTSLIRVKRRGWPGTWNCGEVPRLYDIQQLDAGAGKVVARDRNYAYFLIGASWYRLSTIRFKHVSVGPAGLWGCSTSNGVYKYVAGNFVRSSGVYMQQVDAGGDDQLVGVSSSSYAYCLRSSSALTYGGVGSLSWTSLGRRMRYYSCSPQNGCWGVDTSNNVYYTQTLNAASCRISGWRLVSGERMRMIEVGTDGNVFGVSTSGRVYFRAGISSVHPYGTYWSLISMCTTVRHLSYDLGRLWVVTNSGFALQCTP